MKQSSSMITGPACSGSSTPPMPGAARDVDVAADLRAAADRRPGVDHRAFADVGADVDEARHQHRARRDEGAAADDRAGHRAEAGLRELLLAPAGELGRHLVPPMRAARAAGDRLHRVEAERQQHGLLQPLVDGPLAADLLGDARLAGVERGDRRIDRLADLALGVRAESSRARPRRARSRSASCRSFLVPQDRFRASRRRRSTRTSTMRLVIAVAAALRAIVDPHRRHAERFGRRKVLDHVVDEQRARRDRCRTGRSSIAIAVRIGLGRQSLAWMSCRSSKCVGDAESRRAPAGHKAHRRW